MVDRTEKSVGPGAYREEKVMELLKKKPCKARFHRPELSPDETMFDLQGQMRILQKSFLPRNHKN